MLRFPLRRQSIMITMPPLRVPSCFSIAYRAPIRVRPPSIHLTLPSQISRNSSTSSSSSFKFSQPWRRPRILWIGGTFVGLIVFVVTTKLLVDLSRESKFSSVWPEEVRDDLRAGLRAKRRGEYKLSARHFLKAHMTATKLPLSAFDPFPHLKLSSILIAAGDACELAQADKQALSVWFMASEEYIQTPLSDSKEGTIHSVALFHKLADAIGRLPDQTQGASRIYDGVLDRVCLLLWDEKFDGLAKSSLILQKKVEHLLQQSDITSENRRQFNQHLSVLKEQMNHFERKKPWPSRTTTITPPVNTLDLPSWARHMNVLDVLEAFLDFYRRNPELQVHLSPACKATAFILSATDPVSSEYPTEKECRGLRWVNDLAMIVAHKTHKTDSLLNEAKELALNALERFDASSPLSDSNRVIVNLDGVPNHGLCDQTRTAILFNLGSLSEMAGDLEASKEYYRKSLREAERFHMKQKIDEAQAAIGRLEAQPAEGTPSLQPE